MHRTFIWLSAAVLASATTVSAQTFVTVEITSGTFNVDATGPAVVGASYDFSGAGVHIVADGVEPGNVPAAIQCAGPGCQSGDVFTLDAIFGGSHLGVGTAEVSGLTINPAYFSGDLRLITGELTIPRGNRMHLVMTARFVLDGGLLNVHDSTFRDRPPDLRVVMTGGGTATAFFKRLRLKPGPGKPEFFYDLERVIYTFDTEPAP